MVTGARIAATVAASALSNVGFVESAFLLREAVGDRDDDGVWVPGAITATTVSVVQAPITGQERNTLPEGMRDSDVRKFWVMGDVASLRYGRTDGDRLILGALGAADNTFTGTSYADAVAARDAYATANPAWLAIYQVTVGGLILVQGIYQRWDAALGVWTGADVYRSIRANRWGPFTEVMASRQDPGNV